MAIAQAIYMNFGSREMTSLVHFAHTCVLCLFKFTLSILKSCSYMFCAVPADVVLMHAVLIMH